MTTIAAVVRDGTVWMAADGRAIRDAGVIYSDNREKVIKNTDGSLIGVAGFSRLNDIMRYEVEWSSPPTPLVGWRQHLSKVFCQNVRVALRDSGMLEVINGMENAGGQLIIGTPDGRIFQISELLDVCEFTARGFAAIGSGSPYALGALAVSSGDPARRLTKAIKAAAMFDGATGEVMNVLNTRGS